MRILKPPLPISLAENERSIFLAGSIEMGLAGNWQDQFIAAFADSDIALLNPRRDAWDASWVQSIENPFFREQVEWELNGLDLATTIAMYFDPRTKAPITLLELGLFARSDKVIVGCPPGYWRRGNIEVVCARFNVPLVSTLEELIAAVRARTDG